MTDFHSIALACIIFWSAIAVVVVAATSASEAVHFFRVMKQAMVTVSPAATVVTIPSSFVVSSHGVYFSSLSLRSTKSNIGGRSRSRSRRHYHIPDPRTNPIINDRSMSQNHFRLQNHLFSMGSEDDQGNNDGEPNQVENMILIDELSWRVAKVRLEEANTKRFLNRKPLKMSYLQSRQFIQRNWGPIRTRKEFEDLVSNGDLKTPYISKRPEEYYGRRGEWISWEHYLMGECSSDEMSSGSGESSNTNIGHDRKNGTDALGGWSQDVMLKWQ